MTDAPELTMSYEALVEAGRAAREQADSMQWVEGDLALQVEALPGNERPRDPDTGAFIEDVEKALQRYAEDIDIPYSTLKGYRRTAVAWPTDARASVVSWRVHSVLAPEEDRLELIRPGMTVRQAERIVAKRRASTSGKPGWFELVGHVGTELKDAGKWLAKAEDAIHREPNKALREKAEKYAQRAEDIAARLRRLGLNESA